MKEWPNGEPSEQRNAEKNRRTKESERRCDDNEWRSSKGEEREMIWKKNLKEKSMNEKSLPG